jgi:hypothetical protein
MQNISTIRAQADGDSERAVREATHLFNMLTFNSTTPSGRVGKYIKDAFFSSSIGQEIALLTNKGVYSSKEVRIANKNLQFLTQTPLLMNSLVTSAKDFVAQLQDMDMLKEAGWPDVKRELSSRTLSDIDTRQFLRWLVNENDRLSDEIKKDLISIGTFVRDDGKVMNLGQITSYVTPGKYPSPSHLPNTVIPLEVSRVFQFHQLESLYVFTKESR